MANDFGYVGGGTKSTSKLPFKTPLDILMKNKTPTPAPGSGVFREGSAGTAPIFLPTVPRSTPTGPAPAAPAGPGGTAGGGSGGTSQADKDKAAANLGTIAGYNAGSTKDQFGRAMANYDLSDQQNRQLADVQFKQNSRRGAADRFGQNKKLQSSLLALLAGAGNALQGSGSFSLMDMLRGRQDLDSAEVLGILSQNQNAVRNTLDESLNTNVLARNDTSNNAEFALRGLEADLAAQLSNIDPDLFVAPGTGNANLGSAGFAAANQKPANLAKLAGYYTQAPQASTRAPSTMTGGSYYDRLIDSYNRRSA